jgi:hypothetical protein
VKQVEKGCLNQEVKHQKREHMMLKFKSDSDFEASIAPANHTYHFIPVHFIEHLGDSVLQKLHLGGYLEGMGFQDKDSTYLAPIGL